MKAFKLLMVVFLVGGLAACSHFKSGNKQSDAETAGLDDQSGFDDDISAANRMKAPYNQRYLFGFNKYEVSADDVASINVQAGYLVAHPNAKVRLEGNCDDRGSREYNIALGWKRAKAVAEVLKQQGVNDSQIATVSYGKEKPIAVGQDEDSYSKNRRTDLFYEVK